MNQQRRVGGFSVIELLALVVVIILLASLFMPRMHSPRRGTRIQCVNNLKNIGLAFRVFAFDNNEQFPPALLATNGVELTSLQMLDVLAFLTNQLAIPKLLYCPADKQRMAPTNFANLTPKNISYFVSLSASWTNPVSILSGDRNVLTNGQPVGGLLTLTTSLAPTLSWSKELHNEQGNILMADGAVLQMNSARLQQSIPEQDLTTNYLVFP